MIIMKKNAVLLLVITYFCIISAIPAHGFKKTEMIRVKIKINTREIQKSFTCRAILGDNKPFPTLLLDAKEFASSLGL